MRVSQDKKENEEEEDIYEVEKIVDMKKKGNRTYYLVKWEGYSNEHNTWEDEENIFAKQYIEEYLKTKNIEKQPKKKRTVPSSKKKGVDTASESDVVSPQEKIRKTVLADDDNNLNLSESSISNAHDNIKSIEEYSKSKGIEKKNLMHNGKDVQDTSKVYTKFLSEFGKPSVNTNQNVTNDFDFMIEKVLDVYNHDNELYATVELINGDKGVFHTQFLHSKAPLKLLDFYESKVVFKSSDD